MTGDLRNRSTEALDAQAARLRELHQPGDPVVLANIWDAASAWLAETAGFTAVATSSGAVAESLGYADHEGAPADEMFLNDAVEHGWIALPIPCPFGIDNGDRAAFADSEAVHLAAQDSALLR